MCMRLPRMPGDIEVVRVVQNVIVDGGELE
jgi:hypothetical protein